MVRQCLPVFGKFETIILFNTLPLTTYYCEKLFATEKLYAAMLGLVVGKSFEANLTFNPYCVIVTIKFYMITT